MYSFGTLIVFTVLSGFFNVSDARRVLDGVDGRGEGYRLAREGLDLGSGNGREEHGS